MPAIAWLMFAATRLRFRNNRNSTSGTAVRSSTTQNAASSATPAISGPTTPGSPQPSTGPWLRPKTNPASASASKAAPGRSMRRGASGSGRRSGTERRVSTTTTMASTRLSTNTSRQSIEASRPPSTGPRAAKAAEPPATTPSDQPRRSRGNTLETIAIDVGIISAAPQPWSTRAAIIHPMVCAVAANSVASPKTTAPARNTRRRPNRSPTRPPRIISAASGRMFAVSSHCDSSSDPPRSLTARGVASGTAVWSTRIMLAAIVIAARAIFMSRVTGAGVSSGTRAPYATPARPTSPYRGIRGRDGIPR